MKGWRFIRIAAQMVAFPIWGLELEIETVFIEQGWRSALTRLRFLKVLTFTRPQCEFAVSEFNSRFSY